MTAQSFHNNSDPARVRPLQKTRVTQSIADRNAVVYFLLSLLLGQVLVSNCGIIASTTFTDLMEPFPVTYAGPPTPSAIAHRQDAYCNR
jgi:hypothetical protein